MAEEYEAANAALFKALRQVADEPRNEEAQAKLDEAFSKLEELMPHPFPPSRWRGCYVKDVKNVSDLRDYAEMMLEITRHTQTERALSVLSDAIFNVDSSLVAWRYPGAPPVSPGPRTDDEARRALLGKIQWLNSVVEPSEMDQAATQEVGATVSGDNEQSPLCPVTLKDDGKTAIVCGVEKSLRSRQFIVVKTLVRNFPKRLSKSELETKSTKADAQKVLADLSKNDNDWRVAIYLPGQNRDGYGLNPVS